MQARVLTVRDVACGIGWSTQRARRWLKTTGAGVKRGARIITTPALMHAHFPEAWEEIQFDIGDDREL